MIEKTSTAINIVPPYLRVNAGLGFEFFRRYSFVWIASPNLEREGIWKTT